MWTLSNERKTFKVQRGRRSKSWRKWKGMEPTVQENIVLEEAQGPFSPVRETGRQIGGRMREAGTGNEGIHLWCPQFGEIRKEKIRSLRQRGGGRVVSSRESGEALKPRSYRDWKHKFPWYIMPHSFIALSDLTNAWRGSGNQQSGDDGEKRPGKWVCRWKRRWSDWLWSMGGKENEHRTGLINLEEEKS